MALLKWGDEEDKKKQDLFDAPAIKTVNSVQNGAWQPAPSGADSAVATDDMNTPQPQNYLLSDEKAQFDANQQRERDAEQAQRAAAEQADATRRAQAAEEVAAANHPQADNGSKYVQPQKKDEGVWGFLKGVGAGIQQGLGAVGDIAIQGGGVIGSIGKNDQELTKYLDNVEKVRGWLHGNKDITGNDIVGTRDVEQNAGDIAAGRGDLQDYMAVGGKGLQAGIDSTMFLNPARIATKGLLPVASESARLLPRIVTNPAVQYAARDAAFYGGLQGGATAASTYGQTGDIGEAIKNGAQDALIGGVLQGGMDVGAHVTRKGVQSVIPFANKTINSLRRPGEFTPVKNVIDATENEAGVFAANQERPSGVTPTDGNALPVDGNVNFESNINQPSNLLENAANDTTPTAPAVDLPAPVADGVVQNPVDNSVESTAPTDVTPVDNTPTPVGEVTPAAADTAPVVADGMVQPSKVIPAAANPNMPVIKSEEVRNLQDARAGASQADEAQINQKLNEINNTTPAMDSVPDNMEIPTNGKLTPAQVAERLMPKLADNSDVKTRIANAVDMGKDVESPIREILRGGNVKPAQAERVAKHFDDLESQLQNYNRLEEANQKAYAEGGAGALSEDVSKERSRTTRDMGETTRRLMTEINRIEGSRDYKTRLINSVTDLIGTRNASVLSSAGLLERNIAQEFTANAKLAIKNPIKMARSTFASGNILKDTAKSELSHWKDAPRSPIEALKYIVSNTYRTGMIPTTALANTRRGAVREELTKWAYKELEGRDISSGEAKKLAGAAGNEMEALVNTFIGVDNGMTNRGQATAALRDWKEYIRTGDDGAKAEFLKRVENHNSLADQMIAGLSKEDATRARGLMAVKNLVFPFVRTATNLMKNTVKQDLNPFAKSLLDEIRADQRSGAQNAVNLIKSKLVDYGIMGGAAALASSGVLTYNDGDNVDSPRGWSVKIGDNQYVPVRSTSLELPMAMAGTAQQMAQDIAAGKPREWKYYAGMVTGSLPYIDQFNTTTGAADSLMGGEDAGYAAKSYGVNMAKSFVPFSNNGVQPYVAGKQRQSLNAKSVYDENMATWLGNTIRKNYDPNFYNSLNDSRDNAGRVRTVDNQGVVTNKTMNDSNTAKYNDTIKGLVTFGRENGLGKNSGDMFNTYDTGKNNNFKSVQDAVTFLDIKDGGKPDNAKKLEQNAKLTNLAQQIRSGFYGDTGNDLLTLDGKELKSDASVPNKDGSKNSKLPLSMQSIKNAVAQTDLGTEANDKLYAISGQKTELYNQLKAKSISYDQYTAAKSELEKGEISLLSASPNYQKLTGLMNELDANGFFEAGGIGSTKSGQTYLWNSLNALLGSKGATPAANYPDTSKAFTPFGRGNGISATNKPGDRKNEGVKWTPVGKREMAAVAQGKYTPVNIKVKLGNEIKKNKTQNYSDRSF